MGQAVSSSRRLWSFVAKRFWVRIAAPRKAQGSLLVTVYVYWQSISLEKANGVDPEQPGGIVLDEEESVESFAAILANCQTFSPCRIDIHRYLPEQRHVRVMTFNPPNG